ncbi:MAG: hypothetical protein PHY08_11925 [Candidatus Cloacimonetes bacterium]|nr:hypothetical protein [Candidatus Cloacimonadota bacterium]
MGIQNISGRIIIFILLLGASTITYFIANKDRYVPNDQLYIEYTEQQLLDMQLDYSLSDLNGHTLDEVFGNIPHDVYGFSLPNNVISGFSIHDDKTYHVQRVKKYTLQASDFDLLFTGYSNVDTVRVSNVNLNDIVSPTQYSTGQVYFNGFNQYLGINANLATPPSYIYGSNWGVRPELIVSKGAYASLAEAQADLAGTDIYYQLATPIEIEILDIDTLTIEQMIYYYQMYLEILDGERVLDIALGTIDSNGKDYYHLSVSDYEDLGNNGVVDFKYLFSENGPLLSVSKTLKVVKNFIETGIESFGNFIDGYVRLMQDIKDFIIWWK